MRTFALLILALPAFLLVSPARAASIFEDPENLTVLPEDTDPQTLRDVMRGFTAALGERCSFCHEGRESAPLDTYDFASDDEEHKLIAREMMRMVATINGELIAGMDPATDGEVTVSCATCHRGQSSPKMLADHLDEAFEHGGIRAAKRRYEELRAANYGGFTYDFSEGSLIDYAESLAQRGQIDAALQMLEVNLEYLPDSDQSLVSMAQLLAFKGDTAGALERLDAALDINPRNQQAAEMRRRLRD